MSTWSAWLKKRDLHELITLPDAVLEREWKPSDEDRAAAWDLYTELRTRITTQPLRYRDGDEATALTSLYELFKATRDLLHKYQRKCSHFATLSVFMLNHELRPFTARWHKLKEASALDRQDGCRIFRHELLQLQAKMVKFQTLLGYLAEDADFKEGSETGRKPMPPATVSLGDAIVPAGLLNLSRPDLWASEQAEIRKRRKTMLNLDEAAPANLVGLAISGGGIRSATVALGVVERLAEAGFLAEVDYLSTVSGGGYLGSFISSYVNSNDPAIGPKAGQQPFAPCNRTESPPIRHLRNHSKYLIEGNWVQHLRTVGQAAYGVATNLLIVCPFVILLACLTLFFKGDEVHDAIKWEKFPDKFSLFSLTYVGILAALVLGLAIVQNLGRTGAGWGKFRDIYETVTAVWLLVSLVVVGFELVPALFVGFWWLLEKAPTWVNLGLSLASPPIIGGFVVAVKKYPWVSRVLLKLFWLSGPLAFVLFYLTLTGALVEAWADTKPRCPWLQTPIPFFHLDSLPLWMYMIFDIVVIVYGFTFLNVNMTSPHRFYRDQLAKTYLLKPGPDNEPRADDQQKLSDLGSTGKAPYHLINGSLNLASSDRSDLLGRSSDFFLFSKHWCGSPILGYFPTNDWEKLDGHVNLGTAMAISGAAAAPIMGMASIAGADFLLAVLNVRLAYWLRDPNPAKRTPWTMSAVFGGPGPPYLLREMLGHADEKTAYVNVSDGGHLENLAAYELLRRRCKFIIAIDGECDPTMTCGSFIKLIRFAEIDFGIHIDIDLSEMRTLDKNGYSKAHFALGKIEYSKNEYGFILYTKSTLTGNEPPYVLAYKAKEPAFPHESTGKQLYEEDQFEAYRALGYHKADDLFRPELVGEQAPAGLQDWFQRLANSLL
jgi:hypothetical protein